MPHTVDGAKWSCEGCIRGHRSNKCDHFQDRWMFRVKKPGRPLQNCPHPDKPCPCDEEAYIMVRIPGGPPGAKDSCYCRPVRAAQSPQECRLQTDFPLPWTPRNGSRHAPPSANGSRTTHENNGGNPTYPNNASATPYQGSTYNNGAIQSPYQSSGMKIEGQWPISGIVPLHAVPQQPVRQQMPPETYSPQSASPTYTRFYPQPMLTPRHQSPYGQGLTEPKSSSMPTPAQTPAPQKVGSCCRPPPEEDSTAPLLFKARQNQAQISINQDHPNSPQPQYPDPFTSNGIQQGQAMHRAIPSDVDPELNFHGLDSNMVKSSLDWGGTNHLQLVYNPDVQDPTSMQQNIAMPDNGCQCGSSCNCVYCTKHPTNAATRDRIEELYTIMDGRPSEDLDNGSQPVPAYGDMVPMPHPFELDSDFSKQPYIQGYHNTDTDPQPSGLEPPSFFEMAIPVAGCANGHCRCGDNCACVGCLTHTGHFPALPTM